MNILIVSAVFPPEPVVSAQLSFDTAEKLSMMGTNVTVLCPRPTRPLGYTSTVSDDREYGFRKIILDSYTFPESRVFGRFRESYSFGKKCHQYIKENSWNIDVIYANTWPLFAQYFLVKGSKKFQIPCVLHVQDIYPESLSEKQNGVLRRLLLLLFVPLDKSLLKSCSRVVTISPGMRDYIIRTRQLENGKVIVVRNWQNDSRFLSLVPKEKEGNRDFTFMYLGSISPSASVVTLIDAFGKSLLKNCCLIIAGQGSEMVVCQKTAKKYPDAIIEFIPAPADKVHILQQTADVLLLPLKKGIGMTASPSKLTAYMFSSKPVIGCVDAGSDTAGVINHSGCGWVIEPENSDSLSDLMKRIIDMPKADLENKGKRGLEYAIENLSRDKNLEKLTMAITKEGLEKNSDYRVVHRNEYNDLVKVHMNAFKGFFLTSLGESFLKTYYKASLKSQECVAICVRNSSGEIVGFAIGTVLSKGYHKRLLISNFFPFLFEALIIFFTRPNAIIRLLLNMEKSPKYDDDGLYAELLSIGVVDSVKGSGMGKKLIEGFERELLDRCCHKVVLTTDFENNADAVNFYIKKGYSIFYEFITYPGRKMYKMIKRLK
jgi:glycosyltransferase involved in cell wall biosynthesis/ribosomal protein S18 acetylase RimI-like enzyme